jgi:hypothetical protein
LTLIRFEAQRQPGIVLNDIPSQRRIQILTVQLCRRLWNQGDATEGEKSQRQAHQKPKRVQDEKARSGAGVRN